jgi:hypothetical protein
MSSCTGAAVFPSTLPNAGIVTYATGTSCSGAVTSAQLFVSMNTATPPAALCFDSNTFTCSTTVNGTSATYTTFSDSTNMGLCTTQTSQTTQVASATTCVNNQAYTCAFIPPTPVNPSSASAVSVSAVATMVAAVVALVFSRSL